MPYRGRRKAPQFADLKTTLAQSKGVDNSLYQVVQEIIERLTQFQFETVLPSEPVTGGGGGGGGATKFATYHTKNDETAALPNSVQLLAGTGIVFDDTVANKRTIAATGTALPGPHAPTHSEGNTDPVDVKNLTGYPGGTTAFLRADKTFAVPPGGASGGMEYLGDYVPATYNDGDIVVAADGIAYVCTKNGTTTPPEPWPGVGISVNPIVDATYWTSTPHPTLVNERAFSLIANGYVKNTGGNPSTVPFIPVSEGGTSATNATDARTNLGVGNVGTLNLNGNPATFLNGVGTFTAPVTAGVPSGLIAIFTTACPAGWTRVAAWDGRYLRANSVAGAMGGAYNHVHEVTVTVPDHNHGGAAPVSIVTDTQGSHGHGVQPIGVTGPNSNQDADSGSSFGASRSNHIHTVPFHNTDAAGDHAHNVNGNATIPGAGALGGSGGTDAQDHQPPFIDVVFCMKD